MLTIGGLVFLLVCVFGTFIASGGNIGVLAEAMPFEMISIGGAATATLVMANSMHDVKHTLASFGKVMKGAAFAKADYVDLLSLLFFFAKLASSKGPMALEAHIERPDESKAFQKYPKILGNHHANAMICDYLRMVGMNADDPYQIEDVMAREIKKTMAEELHSAHALQTVADSLPALGIVAAVLGVIHTMGSITEPPEVLGHLIGGALVGTFTGVLLSYTIFAPIGRNIQLCFDTDAYYLSAIKAGLLAHMQGYAPQVSIEFARKTLPDELRPTFQELEDTVTNLPPD